MEEFNVCEEGTLYTQAVIALFTEQIFGPWIMTQTLSIIIVATPKITRQPDNLPSTWLDSSPNDRPVGFHKRKQIKI